MLVLFVSRVSVFLLHRRVPGVAEHHLPAAFGLKPIRYQVSFHLSIIAAFRNSAFSIRLQGD
ncbi:MAG TPA: hypothetical protein VFE72_02465 [Lysobacter sp.]|nr:hypothetical protein [Lysobacter sp.]